MNSLITAEIKTEIYRNHTLEIELVRCGMGGKIWGITILDPIGNRKLGSVFDESFCEAIKKSKSEVDKFTFTNGIREIINENKILVSEGKSLREG